MARDFVKVRKLGSVIVLTLPKVVLDGSAIQPGTRVLVENDGPMRLLVTAESDDKKETA
jgi:antitoxin component of MazEF toxin-antitoxin module